METAPKNRNVNAVSAENPCSVVFIRTFGSPKAPRKGVGRHARIGKAIQTNLPELRLRSPVEFKGLSVREFAVNLKMTDQIKPLAQTRALQPISVGCPALIGT